MIDSASFGLAALSLSVGSFVSWAWHRHSHARLSHDLSESRHLHDRALRQHQTQSAGFEALFDAAPECVNLQTADGIVQRMNPAGLALLGVSPASKIVGQSIYALIAPEYHTAYRQLVRQVFAGENANLAFESIDLDGQRRWLETHAVPMREDGRVATMLAITRDIDERIRMTRQLEEQRNRLHTIIESEPECVKLQHRDGTIFEMNPAGLSLLHAADPQQVIGQNIYDFLTGEYHGAYRQLTQQVFDGEPASMEFQINTLDGQRRWLETHAAPLRDANGEIGALLAITRDIDERKQHEEKLRSHRNQLAHVCRLGTLGELASGLAHELNQPLCAMSSYAESALSMHRRGDARNNTRIDDILRKIVTEAERASGIINRLRDLVQRRVPQPQACPVRELIDEVLDIVEPERRRRSFVFQVDVDDALPPVWVDRVQIEQVLINLLYNALQAEYRLPSSVRCIDIDGRLDGEHVTIAIRDYADGIPEDIRDSLFTPFFTTKPNGIGMGLALSRSIAEAHAGTLHYTAKAPGSRFELGLPPKKDDDE